MPDTYGAPMIAHVPDCPDAPRGTPSQSSRAVLAADGYTRPHGCVAPWNTPVVVLAPPDDAPHAYEPSMIHPRGESRPRCRVCRGTHPGEGHWLYPVAPGGG